MVGVSGVQSRRENGSQHTSGVNSCKPNIFKRFVYVLFMIQNETNYL